MSDDTDEVSLAEALDFGRGMAEEETREFQGEVPEHAPRLVASRGQDMAQTALNVQMAFASERAEDPNDEQVANALAEDAVDVLLALGTLVHEYPSIDIVGKFEERMELVRDYRAFEAAVEDAETEEEIIQAVDDNMTEQLEAMMGGGGLMGGALGGATPIAPGDNVDAENYDHEEEDHGYQ